LAKNAGEIATLATAILDIAQGISGEISGEECVADIAKLGFSTGAGILGTALGGPLLGIVFSEVADAFFDKVYENLKHDGEMQKAYVPGSEKIDDNMWDFFSRRN
jgi:hypothetical protein